MAEVVYECHESYQQYLLDHGKIQAIPRRSELREEEEWRGLL